MRQEERGSSELLFIASNGFGKLGASRLLAVGVVPTEEHGILLRGLAAPPGAALRYGNNTRTYVLFRAIKRVRTQNEAASASPQRRGEGGSFRSRGISGSRTRVLLDSADSPSCRLPSALWITVGKSGDKWRSRWISGTMHLSPIPVNLRESPVDDRVRVLVAVRDAAGRRVVKWCSWVATSTTWMPRGGWRSRRATARRWPRASSSPAASIAAWRSILCEAWRPLAEKVAALPDHRCRRSQLPPSGLRRGFGSGPRRPGTNPHPARLAPLRRAGARSPDRRRRRLDRDLVTPALGRGRIIPRYRRRRDRPTAGHVALSHPKGGWRCILLCTNRAPPGARRCPGL